MGAYSEQLIPNSREATPIKDFIRTEIEKAFQEGYTKGWMMSKEANRPSSTSARQEVREEIRKGVEILRKSAIDDGKSAETQVAWAARQGFKDALDAVLNLLNPKK